MTKNEIKDAVDKGRISSLTFRELRREARRRFWAKPVSVCNEGDNIERMPIYALRLYVQGTHPVYS